nr:RluA family pseudouridine synthase [Peribacillus alkalitolerans]
MNYERKGDFAELAVPKKWEQYTLDSLLKEYWKAPKKLVHEWRMNKSIFVNGKVPNWLATLNAGDRILLPFFIEEEPEIEPTFHEIDVLYEDDHVIVLNKPAGVDTHPSSHEQINSLINFVSFYCLSNAELRKVRHIHRLDKDTTGAILFAKHAFVGSLLDKLLEERKVKRTYLALVQGHLKQKKGTIDQPIGRDRHHATRRRVSPTGQSAITHFQKLTYLPDKKMTLISCQLDTGRTHQIRVHLASIGHPLAGDTLYGGEPIFERQALHAYSLDFVHPITEEHIKVYAPFCDQPPIFPEME